MWCCTSALHRLSHTSRMSRALCRDAAYMKMRLQRISLMDGPMGAQQADKLRQFCDLPK
jgi:hypothetical protein